MRARRQTLRAMTLVFCAAALLGIALPAAVNGAPGDRGAASLRAKRAQIERRSHNALLELYSIETQLQRARAQVSTLDRQEIQLRHESAVLRSGLRLARRAIAATQRILADRARALYESGDQNDPIAIMLGAVSIDDALTRLDNLEQIAGQQNTILRQARQAQSKLLRLRADLERRKAALDRLRAQARVSTMRLEAARADKSSTLHRLSNQRALTSRQLASLSTQATKAAATSIKAEPQPQVQSTTTTPTTAVPATPSAGSSKTLTVSATCYCLTGSTSSGLPVGPGIIATDPSVIPLGTRLYVPGYGNGVAADTGSAVKGNTIDLWVASCEQARAYGRRTVSITIL